MVDIPDREPLQVVAGDTWQWHKEFSDYPAPTWVLTYYLRSKQSLDAIEIVATDDLVGGHDVSVAATVTAPFAPGEYSWTARVVAGAVVTTVGRGFIRVTPDYSNAANDHRTYNERCLDAIEAVRENRASTDQAAFTINDRSITRMTWDELEAQWLRFRDFVAKERGIKVGRVGVRL